MLLRCLLFVASLLSVQAYAPGLLSAPRVARLAPAAASVAAGIRMQVQAPVKTPDIQLAPTDPKNEANSAKGKKFKLLLFNDNMNKCVTPRAPPVCSQRARHDPAIESAATRQDEPIGQWYDSNLGTLNTTALVLGAAGLGSRCTHTRGPGRHLPPGSDAASRPDYRREYVAKILKGSVPGLTDADAYVIMQKAHQAGMAVVGVWVFEVAEVSAASRLRSVRYRSCELLTATVRDVSTAMNSPLHLLTCMPHFGAARLPPESTRLVPFPGLLRPDQGRWAHRIGHRGGIAWFARTLPLGFIPAGGSHHTNEKPRGSALVVPPTHQP